MRMFWPFGRHRRWLEDVDAFVDGELVGERASRFESHLARCADCAALVAEQREVKLLTMALPAVRAPRSFQITPGMLVEAHPAPMRRATRSAARLAQLTAGVAALAFVAVLVADLSSGDGDSRSAQQATSADDAAGGAGEGAADRQFQSSPAPATSAAGVPSASPSIPGVGPSVGAAGNPDATPAVPATGRDSSESATPTAPTDNITKGATETQASPAEALGDAASIEAEDGDDGGGNGRALLLAELALAALAVVAAGTWVVARRRNGA